MNMRSKEDKVKDGQMNPQTQLWFQNSTLKQKNRTKMVD